MNLVALFLLCITLCGCTSASQKIMVDSVNKDVAEDVMAQTSNENELLIGADISEDSIVKEISDFEELTGKHDIYADEIYITESEKAEKFILECYASGKIPYIILKCQDNIRKDSFKESVDKIAETIGKYQVTVFIEIFENGYFFDTDNEYYKYAAEKLYEFNSFVKRVWSVKADDIMIADKYCPESNVDYICVNGYFNSENEVERFFTEKTQYYTGERPLIIRFGAASFISEGCKYTSDEACSTINKVYEKSKIYNDIQGVIYMDKSNRISNKIAYSNYYITIDKKVTEAYKNSIS